MKEKEEKMHFPKIDDFFTTQEERDAEKLEKVEKINRKIMVFSEIICYNTCKEYQYYLIIFT